MQDRGGDQHALAHALRVVGHGGVEGVLEREQTQQLARFFLERTLCDAAQTADQLQILEPRQVGVDLRFLWHMRPMTILTVVDLPLPLGPR